MAQRLKTILFIGSAREGRMADRVVALVRSCLEADSHDVHVIDPRQIDLPLLRQPLHFYPDASKAPDALKRIDAEIRGADAFVFLTAEYNRCIAPALTNTLDHFAPASYARRPSAIVSYSMGPQGGLSAALQVRSLAGELGCPSIGKMAHIMNVQTTVDEAGKADERVLKSVKEVVGELRWWAEATKAKRASSASPKK